MLGGVRVLQTGDRFLTIDQVSEYLQVPKNTLYKYTSENTTRLRLRGVRIGRALRFRLSDVDKWLEELGVNDSDS
ncbi:helix-turn-helix domain-containing protein [Candidatus Poribacteria bacterium]